MSKDGTSNNDIDIKINQGRRAIDPLNSILYNDKISEKTKTIYSTIVENIVTYGPEMLEHDRNEEIHRTT